MSDKVRKNVYLTQEAIDKGNEIAKQQDRSFSSMLNQLIMNYNKEQSNNA